MKNTKVMSKSVVIALVVFLSLMLTSCSGSSPSGGSAEIIDSTVSYDLVVPTQSGKDSVNVFFSLPFYRICSKDASLQGDNEWDNVQEFTVGDNAEASGDNTDAINGMNISITQTPLSEVVGSEEDYIDSLLTSYEKKYGDEINSEDISRVVHNYYENYYLITANASYDGIIEKDVIINSITIPEIEFSYSFDSFTIRTKEIDDDNQIEDDNGEAIEYSAYSGSFIDSFISRLGYYHLEGKALRDISSMRLFSLDDKCTVIDSSNYNEYSKDRLLDGIEEPDYIDSLDKGESVDQDYYYIFNSADEDAIVTNLAFETCDSGGTKRWLLVYQPSSIAGQYLLIKAIHESN